MPRSRPPYSTGQFTTDQRSPYMVRSQARWASKPSAVSKEGSGSLGTCAASQESSSALKVRSMAQRISHSHSGGANVGLGADAVSELRARGNKVTTARVEVIA